MPRLLSSLGCLLVADALTARSAEPAEQLVRRVADHIVSTTTFTIFNRATGERWPSTEGVPYSRTVAVECPYHTWEYWNGVLNLSMVRLGQGLNEPK